MQLIKYSIKNDDCSSNLVIISTDKMTAFFRAQINCTN